MNEVQGYYSCSINPTYISTWFTSFKGRRAKEPIVHVVSPELSAVENVLIENSEITGFEDFAVSAPISNVPVNLADNSHKGKISPTALRKIKKAIDYTVYLAAPKSLPESIHGKNFKFRLNFITLTLSSPQIHDDREVKNKIFQPMLNSLRDKFHVINYVWRAEKQGNGNIHFHLVTDQWIPWKQLRECWNNHQNKLGYIDQYRKIQTKWHQEGFRLRTEFLNQWSEKDQVKAWKEGKKSEWNSPNSTDVHSLRTITNVKSYFVKYMTKDCQSDDNRSDKQGQFSNIAGRLWGCSSRLSNIKGARAVLDNELTEELTRMSEDKEIKSFKEDFFHVSFVDIQSLMRKGYTLIPQLFEEYIRRLFPEYRPPDLFDQD